MKRVILALTVGVSGGLAGPGCAGSQPPPPEPEPEPYTAAPQIRQAYTLVNLHPDETNQRLYSMNYQQRGLIPLCSQASILSVDQTQMRFVVHETGREYSYIFHERTYEAPEVNLQLYFGPECNPPPPSSFTPLEQEGIRAGKVVPGMSKRAVILAMGYPPRHATPTLEQDQWQYWSSRFDRVIVNFKDGRVDSVKD